MKYGIDLSSNNHGPAHFDFSQAFQADYVFCINKVTESIGYVNPYYNGPAGTDANDAAGAGLATGAYHFARPEFNGPQAEADHFLKNKGNPETTWLDLEDGLGRMPDQDLANWAVIWMNEVDATGIYWSRSYQARLLPHMSIDNRLQWVAAPDVSEWPHAAWIWQCGQMAVPGIGVVDINREIML